MMIRKHTGFHMTVFQVRAEKWLGGILNSTIALNCPPIEDDALNVALASELYKRHKTMVTRINIDKIVANLA